MPECPYLKKLMAFRGTTPQAPLSQADIRGDGRGHQRSWPSTSGEMGRIFSASLGCDLRKIIPFELISPSPPNIEVGFPPIRFDRYGLDLLGPRWVKSILYVGTSGFI